MHKDTTGQCEGEYNWRLYLLSLLLGLRHMDIHNMAATDMSVECTTQENSLVLEVNAIRRKMPKPRIKSHHVVNLTTSIIM